jgi:hypothetical protein
LGTETEKLLHQRLEKPKERKVKNIVREKFSGNKEKEATNKRVMDKTYVIQ